MSVTTHLRLVTAGVPRNPERWLGQIFSAFGAAEMKSGSIKRRSVEEQLGSVSAEHVGKAYEPGALLHADLGGPPRLREMREGFSAGIESSVIGDYLPSNVSLRVGEHTIHCLTRGALSTRTVGFELSLWGYSSPKNDELFVKRAAATPDFKRLKAEIDRLIGPTEITYMIYG